MSEIECEYFELTKVTVWRLAEGEFRIASAAVVTCSLCGRYISGSGGPGEGPICIACGELVMRGGARGAIVWEEKP